MPGSGSKAFRAYLSYVFNSSAKWNLALAVVVPALVIVFYVFTLFTSVSELLRFLLPLTGMTYYLLTVVAVYSFTLDLSRGTCVTFLSQPLTRRGYALAWLLASATVPALTYVLSFAVPFLVLDIRILVHSNLGDYVLLFLEGFTITMIMFFAGLTTRRPSLVVLLGLLLHLLLYAVISIVYSIATLSLATSPSRQIADWVALVLYSLYPFRSLLAGVGYSRLGVYLNAATAAALVAASLEYAKRRLEVTG